MESSALSLQYSRRTLLASMLCGSSALAAATGPPTREKAMAQSLALLENECKLNAGGDWQNYYTSLRPFRLALWPRLKEAYDNPISPPDNPKLSTSLISLIGRPGRYYTAGQLAEIAASHAGGPIELQDLISKNPSTKIIQSASSWLRKQGIELIFVPGPIIILQLSK